MKTFCQFNKKQIMRFAFVAFIVLSSFVNGGKVHAQQNFMSNFAHWFGIDEPLEWPFKVNALNPNQPISILFYLSSLIELLLFVVAVVGVVMGFRIIFIQYLSAIDKYDEEGLKRSKKRLGYIAMGWIILMFGLIFVKVVEKLLNIDTGII